MPIKKRDFRRPKPFVPLLPPKVRKHNNKCDNLYNRLQQSGKVTEVCEEIAEHINAYYDPDNPHSMLYLASCIMERVDCKVETLQMNYPDHVSYRVAMTFTDRDKKPRHGYLHPSVTAVSRSTSLGHAIILVYVSLSKQVGHFP